MKDTTQAMIANFRERREYLDTPELRRFAADCIRTRFKLWGHRFTRNSERLLCNQREYAVIYKLTTEPTERERIANGC